ncbi:MAG: beta-glucosidase [Candidatus Sifarchaeia archaeon]
MDEKTEIENRVNDLLSRLTLNEKFRLLSSHGRLRIYSTQPIKRLKIPSFKMTDGPLGVAMHSSGFKKNTRFPAPVALAASWNRKLMSDIGTAMGKEVRAVGRHVLLAPGMNICRTPLNGRTFEYFSEDPFLTKELAIPFVKGVQSQRVAACLKHYAANNQEIDRSRSSSEIDERTLHEIYLRGFRGVVKEAEPWAIMTSYNMVNGIYASENKYLLQDTLIDKWGFEGLVMTDWFASRPIKSTESCINAGMTLEMPWPSKYNKKSLENAYKDGKFTDETLNDRVRRNIRVMMLTGLFDKPDSLPKGSRNTPEHQNLVRHASEEGMVLLKNKENILPLQIGNIERIGLYGRNLRKKFGGILSGGSSGVSPPYQVTPLEGLRTKARGKIEFATNDTPADLAIVFAGLNHSRGGDSEFMDRSSLRLDDKQVREIKKVASDNHTTVVCLIAGSPIAMDEWIDDVEAILMCWYGGTEAGNAIANVLFGDVNPSGKLPLTFPKRIEDSPAHSTRLSRNYPGDEDKRVFYEEGVFVGYRWFDDKTIEPLFPFGFGLSYTDFEYGEINLNRQSIVRPDDELVVSVDVTNIGESEGSEVIQVYVRDPEASVNRPPKELVGFEKLCLKKGEKGTAFITLKADDLAFYDESSHDWKIESGDFKILVGKSSREILADDEFSYG